MEPSRCYGYPWTGQSFYAVVELAFLGELSSHELATLINIVARYINKFDNETNDILQVGRLYSKLFSYFAIFNEDVDCYTVSNIKTHIKRKLHYEHDLLWYTGIIIYVICMTDVLQNGRLHILLTGIYVNDSN